MELLFQMGIICRNTMSLFHKCKSIFISIIVYCIVLCISSTLQLLKHSSFTLENAKYIIASAMQHETVSPEQPSHISQHK